MPRRSTRGYQATVCVHIVTQSSGFCGDEAYFALQTGVKCRAAEAELVLVRLRWRTHEGEVVLSLPMSLEKEKAKVNSPCMRAEVLVMAGKKEMLWLLAHKLRYLLTFRLAASLSGASGVPGCERVPLR